MTAVDYDPCESRLLVHEGSVYTNDPQDPGGPTRWGVTIYDARLYWKPNATPDDVRTMPVEVAKAIYRQKYWARMRCDDLQAGVDDCIFDYGVNSGIGRSGKVLRRILRLPDNTSVIDDSVIKAAALKDPHDLVNAICDERLAFLQSLRTWPHFGGGWGRRVAEVRAFALHLANVAAQIPSTAPVIAHPAEPQAKGAVPQAGSAKKTITRTAGAASAGTAAIFIQWITAHPLQTGLLAAAALLIVANIVDIVVRAHHKAQEGPPPNWKPPTVLDVAPVQGKPA